MAKYVITGEMIRAVIKAKQEGVDALTDEERNAYDAMQLIGQDFRESFDAYMNKPGIKEAHEAYEAMSDADKMRYMDWTPGQLAVLLPLIQGGNDA